MKTEQIASMLEIDQTELESTYKLTQESEIDEKLLTDIVKAQLKEIRVRNLSEGKKQGEGKAKREARTEIENILKEKFNVTGLFDDQVNSLQEILNKKQGSGDEIQALRNDNQTLKNQIGSLEKVVKEKDDMFKTIEVNSTVKQKLFPLIKDLDFTTEKVKDIAIKDFLSSNKFEMTDNGEVLIEKNGTLTTLFEKNAKDHFLQYAKESTPTPRAASFQASNNGYGTDLKTLTTAYRNAKTTEEKASIQKEMKQLIEKEK